MGNLMDPCHIYDTKMILDLIKNGTPIEAAAEFARACVSKKARELGFVDDWNVSTDSSSRDVSVSKSSSTPPPTRFCPMCGQQFGRPQEWQRHILSTHLPYWLHCPYPRCPWRGHRREEFKTHLKEHPNFPQTDPCHIYDTKIVLDLIRNGTPVEVAAKFALDFVSEKAHELGFVDEWENRVGGDRISDVPVIDQGIIGPLMTSPLPPLFLSSSDLL
jgi:hypothetical protein